MNKNGNKALAAQSKAWILQALLHLMQKKNFEHITIKEISEKAGVDRKTFYRNFNTKYDVLQLYLDRACEEYIDGLKNSQTLSTFTISKVYFDLCLKHIDFMRVLDKNSMLVYVLMAFDKYLPIIHKIFESEQLSDHPIYNSEYALSFFTGGFWNISVRWIKEGASKTPTEMANIVEILMTQPL